MFGLAWNRRQFCFAVALALLLAGLEHRRSLADQPALSVNFAEHIQPIFATHCYDCHGINRQESNYRLDLRGRALGHGDLGTPIIPGNAAESPLLRYVSGEDGDLVMPPPDVGQPLSADQITLLRNWIAAGASWPVESAATADSKPTTDHWSFQPVANPPSPPRDLPWGTNTIDAFVLAKLEENDLEPSGPANPVMLIRRLYLDMHGLPPTPDQVASFSGDSTEAAYERVVDEVLASHHYGERWARHWLDVVRFGESTGFEVNRDRENAYHYRDYVIDAFNSDKSYRDFVIEQLAGDVVGADVGTGFLVGGPYDMVKSPDINLTLMQRQDELADYVNTTGTAFLAMTIGCARCHNHKFDPISQRDYYSMQAVFAGVQHGERELSGPPAIRQQIQSLEQEISELQAQLATYRTAALSSATAAATEKLPAVVFAHNSEVFEPIEARFIRFTVRATSGGGQPCIDELQIYSVDEQNVALAALGAIPTASGTLTGYDIHKLEHINDGLFGNGHSWISNTRGGGWIQIELPHVTRIHRIDWGRDRDGVFHDRLATNYDIEVAAKPNQWRTVATAHRRKPFKHSRQPDEFIAHLPAETAGLARAAFDRLRDLPARIEDLRGKIPKAYIGTFKTPEPIHRLFRGDPLAPREVVVPDTLSVCASLKLTNDTPEAERRLALANWIASRDNPLTARVIVNRVWHYHFGSGLVSTPSDFGKNGTLPSHPMLLDWLAWNFMQNGWSLKWLHREILTSRTYQQASTPRPDALAKDADSRWLWRFPPRRLEAEAIRDCVLHTSGGLNPQSGGPGFLLFEIDHENVHHYHPKQEFGPNEFRRMIYMTKIRQEQDEVFGVFDCPDGSQVIPNRSRSTTPLQALNLLNSKFMLQQADLLAERVAKEVGNHVPDQVKRIFELAFVRPPDERELSWATNLVTECGLVELCRAMFNSNEFLFLS